MNFHALCSILLQHTNSPRVGLDSHFSGGSVSFRDYTPLVKINMYAPAFVYHAGTCLIFSKLNLINLILNLWIRGGTWSRVWVVSNWYQWFVISFS